MVLYFTSNVVSPPATIFMGFDKHENEELIRWGFEEDVWFHVDKVSSAHVYLRLKEGERGCCQVLLQMEWSLALTVMSEKSFTVTIEVLSSWFRRLVKFKGVKPFIFIIGCPSLQARRSMVFRRLWSKTVVNWWKQTLFRATKWITSTLCTLCGRIWKRRPIWRVVKSAFTSKETSRKSESRRE